MAESSGTSMMNTTCHCRLGHTLEDLIECCRLSAGLGILNTVNINVMLQFPTPLTNAQVVQLGMNTSWFGSGGLYVFLGAQLRVDRIENVLFDNVPLASFSLIKTCLGKGCHASHDVQMIIAAGSKHPPIAPSTLSTSIILSAT